uniref:Ubiquitin protein ligase E3 component n-recognin 2 n=1 Tax=Molossus molossus TaxID=27622 RepID=A0A7J8GVA9_MOLMO|nr:ubiquitin protein ligase E3 component n-recognin 2 [Molossus molossus]
MASELEPEPEGPAIDQSLLECSAEETAGKWLQSTDLTREVYQHLAHYVPKIYCRGPNPFPQKEDMLAQHVLLGPMEWYICGEDPAFGFPKLEEANKPSHLCGRVFKLERWIAVYMLAHLVHSWDSLCAQASYSFSIPLFLLRGAFLE